VTTPQAPTRAAGPSTFHLVWTALALVLTTAVVYLPVRRYGFVNWDDLRLVASNPHLAHGLTFQSVRWALTTTYDGYWTPFTWLSRLFDVSVFGLAPGGHHVTNVLIHLANVLLLGIVLWRMTGRVARSWSVAALFALHPIHVESVAWISERKDVLSATGFLLTLWAYHVYARRGGGRRYAIVAAMMCVSALAKPMVVTLPAVLLLVDVWPLRRVEVWSGTIAEWIPLVRKKLPLFAVATVVSVVTVITQRSVGAVAGLDVYPIRLRIENAVVSYVRYLAHLCWPVDLSAYYRLPPHILPDWRLVAASIVLLAAISVAVVRGSRRWPSWPSAGAGGSSCCCP
jgi:hypothetical protein